MEATLIFLVTRVFELIVALWAIYLVLPYEKNRFNLHFMRQMLSASLPIGIFYITLSIYNYIDMVMIAAIRTSDEVGWYAASYRLYEGPAFVPFVIGSVFMTYLSRAFSSNKRYFDTILFAGLRVILHAAFVVGINMYVFAEELISLSYGTNFKEAVRSLKVLIIGIPFLFLINFLQNAYISMDRQKQLTRIAAGALLANVTTNLVLIPIMGFVGAAVATVVVEMAVCAVLLYSIRSAIVRERFISWLMVTSLLLAGILTTTVFFTNDLPIIQKVFFINILLAIAFLVELFRPNGSFKKLRDVIHS
jgi:O-antigen/teichoic acid export membrane protein